MFGRKKHQSRKSTNPVFILFRLMLSLIMFVILLAGAYTAYKHFSGLDLLKLDPQSIIKQVLGQQTYGQIITIASSVKLPQTLSNITEQKEIPKGKQLLKFLLVTDTHNDNTNLKKAITQSKKNNPDLQFIIGLGDYTDVGTIDELNKAKNEFDLSTLRYFLVVGDHDLWDCRNKSLPPNCNFREVFGPSYQSFIYDKFKFILLYNSDNYLGIDEEQLNWLSLEFDKSKQEGILGIYVFVHEPLFHPSSDHVMGRVDSKLKEQARQLIFKLKEAGVKKIFAGDVHYFSEYEEPETKTSMVTIGALVLERNPQTPRYGVVTVFEDGNIKVEDVEVK